MDSESFPSWNYCSPPKTVVSLRWSPVICYMNDTSIFISTADLIFAGPPFLPPWHIFTANRYRSIRDYRNLVLLVILNYDTSFLWILAQPHGPQFRSKVITHWTEFSFVLFSLVNTY